MEIFVVSLKDAIERRKHIDEQFVNQQIEFQYFDAIEPHQVNDIKTVLGVKLKNSSLTEGEKGCFLSHIFLWQSMIDKNLPYIVVFEDDIYLGDEAKQFLSNINWIPKNIDIIKLEAFSETVLVKLFSKKKLIANRCLYLLKGQHLGTAGYIISNQGAKNILNYIEALGVIKPIDDIMFDSCIAENKVHQIFPALCMQDFIYNKENIKFKSFLQADRLIRQTNESNPSVKVNGIILKLKKEFIRIFYQIYNLHYKFFEKKVKFK